MPKQATSASKGEFISHFNAVRMRLLGSGNLQLILESLGDEDGVPTETQDLIPIPMASRTNIEPTRLANFRQMRASLVMETTEFGEWFSLSRLIIFSKPTATGYPGSRMS